MNCTTTKILNKDIIKKIIKECFMIFFIVFLLSALLLNPQKYTRSMLDGLSLFYLSVLPGLFPFMVLTRMLSSINGIQYFSKKAAFITKKMFCLPGISMYILIISMLSGYPVGVKITSELLDSKTITEQEAKKMLSFAMSSGPIFIIGSVGTSMLGNIKAGIIILISHYISNIITGVIFCHLLNKRQNQNSANNPTPILTNQTFDNIITNSMFSAVKSILLVGGFISCFYVFSQVLIDYKILTSISYPLGKILDLMGFDKNIATGIMSGIIEVTRGAKMLSSFFLEIPKLVMSLIAALISFSGISILLQSKSLLAATKIKTHFLILIKSVHALLCFIICLVLSNIFF